MILIFNRIGYWGVWVGFEWSFSSYSFEISSNVYLIIRFKVSLFIQVFSTNPSFKNFCLAHLFTHTAFDNGVLGLAYIGSPRSYSVGGICSPCKPNPVFVWLVEEEEDEQKHGF